MTEPMDHRLFELTSAAAMDGLEFIERRISAKRRIRNYDNWPTVTWTEERMPSFSFLDIDPPIDYKDAFNSSWYAFGRALFNNWQEEEFQFDTNEPYQHLKQYIRSEPRVVSHLFPPEIDEGFFDHSVKWFLEQAIDRCIHLSGQPSFNSDKFLAAYLPLEAGLLLDDLPIDILVPVLRATFPLESYELGDGVSIARMSEPVQLARARLGHNTHEVSEFMLQEATHALVLRDYVLPNLNYRERGWGYEAKTFPVHLIDAFFASLRMITSVETGYAQLLRQPIGWAHDYVAGLPPLEGTTIRKYPPNLTRMNAFYGEIASEISTALMEKVRTLFAAVNSIQQTKGRRRLELVIKRLNSCYMREEQEDAILDATIGLEILLSDGDTQEVTHKLALRLAALSSLIPDYAEQAAVIFRNVKNTVYPYRSAVVHGNEKQASRKRELKAESGETIPAVTLAVQYLGMAVQVIAQHPEYLDPKLIDEKLLLGRKKIE